MTKERLHYMDIAKGILILLVVWGHIDGTATALGCDNKAIDDIHRTVNIYVSFYMPCFFVITGFCSNFNKPLNKFLVMSLKSILLPAFIFSFIFSGAWNFFNLSNAFTFLRNYILFGGSYWFLSALFISRILYWFINRCPATLVAILCIVSFIVGYQQCRIPHKYEYWWYVHALCMMPYLGLGQFLRHYNQHLINVKIFPYSLLIYVSTLLLTVILTREGLLQKDCFFDVPGVTLGFINLNRNMFFPLLILSISGSTTLLGLCRHINSNIWLEFIGKNSLVIYCVQGIALSKSMASMALISKLLGGAEFGNDYWLTIISLMLSFFASVLICIVISWIMNRKYLRCLLGKF